MQESPVCKRLDRFLYSNEWELSFPQSLQEVLPRWTSDHWPIVLDTNPFKWGPTPFRFENMWLQHHNFKECFSSWWREFEGNGWEGHKFMRKLQFVKAKLKDWNKNTFGMLKERKKTILDEIANIDAIEQEGALSSDLAAQRVNFIKFLENERGLVLDFREHHRGDITYFKKLYSSPPSESWRVEDRDKAPGPDGFTIAYSSVQDFGCDQGRLTKVLSGRLRGVLQETIHSTQGAFVQGRQILDAVLIANEIVDEKRRSGEEGVVFKIDFEKAYDHVKWDFLIIWVKASRGLRQGDPLSPFLFTIVADVLSRMLLKAEERSLLRASGLAYTLSGSSFGREPTACGFWDPVIERISRRLDGWQKAYLSFGGRITLLHSCLSHIPSYFLSLFKIPASVAAKIERMQRDFLGQGLGKVKEIILLGGKQCASRGQMVTPLSLEGHCTRLSGFFQVYSVYRRRWGKNSLLGRFVPSQMPDSSPFFPTKFVGNLKSLSKLRPLSGLWHTRRRISRSSLPPLFSDVGVVAQTFSASQDGLGSSEKHFRHDVHQL
ncbi:hypothetical protein CK203_046066 [Vitis vinifera]|uniref:Reverse transcriptase domain-containing protein n=1 Tax=Vitis vinifera TaxID=29760 RepID=A0A438HP23_VITVI|nr:hypothetical protein CK203_046066 [Vitis vinifera]